MRQVSCANKPKLWNATVRSLAEVIEPKGLIPLWTDAILPKNTAWVYWGGEVIGDNRRKSTPNFRLCEPLCTETLSRTLICRWRFLALGPSINWPFRSAKMRKTISACWLVNGLGNGS